MYIYIYVNILGSVGSVAGFGSFLVGGHGFGYWLSVATLITVVPIPLPACLLLLPLIRHRRSVSSKLGVTTSKRGMLCLGGVGAQRV